MSKNPLRLGITGASNDRGWAKDAHQPALARLPRFKISAVSAPTLERAQAAAKAYGADHAFGDSLALAKSPDVDIVVVTVRVPDHMPIVMAALDAGKHVFCEWPLGRTVAEAEAMVAAAKKAGVVNMVGLQGPMAPAARQAAAIISSGALGQIYSARMIAPVLGWPAATIQPYAYLNEKKNGATLATIPGGHTLSMVETMLGHFTTIQAQTATHNRKIQVIGSDKVIDRDCADHMALIGTHASGCITVVEIAGSRPMDSQTFFEVSGSKGELRITGNGGGFQTADLTLTTNVDGPPLPASVAPGLHSTPGNVAELYARLAVACDGGKLDAPDFAEALRMHRLLAAIDVAAETGQRQTIKG
jgi:predicted dehydrogenase